VHGKGLKFGIYTSAGTRTCNKDGGFPGGLNHEEQDAKLRYTGGNGKSYDHADWGDLRITC